MDLAGLAHRIDDELRARATPGRAEREKAYLKSPLAHYGTAVPAVRAVAQDVARRHPQMTREDLLLLVDALWARPVHELRLVTVELLHALEARLDAVADAALLERLVRASGTWALVDPLATSVVGRLCERAPELGPVLDRWAVDDDYWVRRASLLALLPGLRRGEGDFDRFSRYADALLDDRELFVAKAIGWVLRDTARKRPDLVYQWLLPRAAKASGVTVREAVKAMSAEQRAAVLAAR